MIPFGRVDVFHSNTDSCEPRPNLSEDIRHCGWTSRGVDGIHITLFIASFPMVPGSSDPGFAVSIVGESRWKKRSCPPTELLVVVREPKISLLSCLCSLLHC